MIKITDDVLGGLNKEKENLLADMQFRATSYDAQVNNGKSQHKKDSEFLNFIYECADNVSPAQVSGEDPFEVGQISDLLMKTLNDVFKTQNSKKDMIQEISRVQKRVQEFEYSSDALGWNEDKQKYYKIEEAPPKFKKKN